MEHSEHSAHKNIQTGILHPIPDHASYLTFDLAPGADPRAALNKLASLVDGQSIVAGLGLSVLSACNKTMPQLREFPVIPNAQVTLPVNRAALWCWLRDSTRGALAQRTRRLVSNLEGHFSLQSSVDAFRFEDGRDLTGYVDGTENPKDQAAINAAIVDGQGAGLDGGSFVAIQQWLHRWPRFEAMSQDRRDNAIGRRLSDNEELDDAPESAHVKRTAQEDFDPEAFVLRRSMPWSMGAESGFYFVAFGRSLDAFEAQLTRMSGAEDGIVDGLFGFTEPRTGFYFWCPPLKDGQLDLSWLLQ